MANSITIVIQIVSMVLCFMGFVQLIVRHLIFRIDPEKRKKALRHVAQIIFGVQVLLRSLSRSAIRFLKRRT